MSILKTSLNLPYIPIQISNNSSCPYIKDMIETRAFISLSDHPETHDQLAEIGFRRVENWAYKPICMECSQCIPIRINCKKFKPNKSQRRYMKTSLKRKVLPSEAIKEHFKLFKKYQYTRHQNGLMSKMTWFNFSSMINQTPINSMIFEYKNFKNDLMGVLLIDIQRDGLSAVYSFYDPSYKKLSIGKYMIIDTINFIKENKLKHLYLGYYIKNNQKMNYKNQFQPYEIFTKGNWSMPKLN